MDIALAVLDRVCFKVIGPERLEQHLSNSVAFGSQPFLLEVVAVVVPDVFEQAVNGALRPARCLQRPAGPPLWRSVPASGAPHASLVFPSFSNVLCALTSFDGFVVDVPDPTEGTFDCDAPVSEELVREDLRVLALLR